jgi:hypothetical protein
MRASLPSPYSLPGTSYYEEPVRGSYVVCHLLVRDETPDKWTYYLRSNEEHGYQLLAVGQLDFPELNVTAEQVARIAFLLELEYPS